MNRTPFPLKLHMMLEQARKENITDVISWSSDGMSFRVHQPKVFEATIMRRYFRQSKFKSFQRQLYIYSFDRIREGPDKGGYRNDMFVEWDRELCKQMTPKKVTKNESSQATSKQSGLGGALPTQDTSITIVPSFAQSIDGLTSMTSATSSRNLTSISPPPSSSLPLPPQNLQNDALASSLDMGQATTSLMMPMASGTSQSHLSSTGGSSFRGAGYNFGTAAGGSSSVIQSSNGRADVNNGLPNHFHTSALDPQQLNVAGGSIDAMKSTFDPIPSASVWNGRAMPLPAPFPVPLSGSIPMPTSASTQPTQLMNPFSSLTSQEATRNASILSGGDRAGVTTIQADAVQANSGTQGAAGRTEMALARLQHSRSQSSVHTHPMSTLQGLDSVTPRDTGAMEEQKQQSAMRSSTDKLPLQQQFNIHKLQHAMVPGMEPKQPQGHTALLGDRTTTTTGGLAHLVSNFGQLPPGKDGAHRGLQTSYSTEFNKHGKRSADNRRILTSAVPHAKQLFGSTTSWIATRQSASQPILEGSSNFDGIPSPPITSPFPTSSESSSGHIPSQYDRLASNDGSLPDIQEWESLTKHDRNDLFHAENAHATSAVEQPHMSPRAKIETEALRGVRQAMQIQAQRQRQTASPSAAMTETETKPTAARATEAASVAPTYGAGQK